MIAVDPKAKIADVRSALSTDDVPRIKAAREALMESFHKVTESIYRTAGAGAGTGAGYEEGPGQSNQGKGPSHGGDDTIEGEFHEM